MSEANVELVRDIYARRLLDTREGHVELVAMGIEYINPPDAIDPGVRRGPAVAEALDSLLDAFERTENRPLQFFDAGDKVVAAVRFHSRGSRSGADLEHDEVHTWTFKNGEVATFEWGRDLGAALQASGIPAD
jgi:ketosteroid isomerase-like protein